MLLLPQLKMMITCPQTTFINYKSSLTSLLSQSQLFSDISVVVERESLKFQVKRYLPLNSIEKIQQSRDISVQSQGQKSMFLKGSETAQLFEVWTLRQPKYTQLQQIMTTQTITSKNGINKATIIKTQSLTKTYPSQDAINKVKHPIMKGRFLHRLQSNVINNCYRFTVDLNENVVTSDQGKLIEGDLLFGELDCFEGGGQERGCHFANLLQFMQVYQIWLQNSKTAQKIQLRLQEWNILDEGEEHIILESKNVGGIYNQIIILSKLRINQFHEDFVEVYEQIVRSNKIIKQVLLIKQRYKLEQSQVNVIIDYLNKKSIKFDSKQSKIKNYLYLTPNLKKQIKFTHLLEFKPKTPLPDIYSQTFITKFCEKFNLKLDIVETILSNAPEVEKTRWFKKNCNLKEKKNMDPFEIFCYGKKDVPDYFKKICNLNGQKISKKKSNIDKRKLNEQIQQILTKSQILQQILQMQESFTKPLDFHLSSMQNWIKKPQTQYLQMIKKEFTSKSNKKMDLHQKISKYFLKSTIVNDVAIDPAVDPFLFLMSLAWRDISVIILMRLDEGNSFVQDWELKIIDYDLKNLFKIEQNLDKEEEFLREYLIYKGV